MSTLGIVTAAPLSLPTKNRNLSFTLEEAANRNFVKTVRSDIEDLPSDSKSSQSVKTVAYSSVCMGINKLRHNGDGPIFEDHGEASTPTLVNYIPPGLTCELNEENHLTVHALGRFTIGHIWGPYLLHLNHECRQRLEAWDEQSSPSTLKLAVKNTDNTRDGNTVLLGEEHTWIKILHETKSRLPDKPTNVDLIIDPMLCPSSQVAVNGLRSELSRINTCTSHLTSSQTISSPSEVISSVGSTLIGPKRDKKCSYCGIPFSNLDTLNAHMTHYCSRRPHSAQSKSIQSNHESVQSLADQPNPQLGRGGTSAKQTNKTQNTVNRPGTSNKRFTSQTDSNLTRSNSLTLSTICSEGIRPTVTPPIDRHVGFNGPSTPQSVHPFIDPSLITTLLQSIGYFNPLSNEQSLHAMNLLPYLFQMTGLPFPQAGNTSPVPTMPVTSLPNISPTIISTNDRFPHNQNSIDLGNSPPPLASTEPMAAPTNHSTTSHSSPLYCKGCQQFFTSNKLYQSHIHMSAVLKDTNVEESAQPNLSPSQLVAAVHKLGLVLTAPLVTSTGILYVPIHPNCGRMGENEIDLGSIDQKHIAGKVPTTFGNSQSVRKSSQNALDLSCSLAKYARSSLTPEKLTDERPMTTDVDDHDTSQSQTKSQPPTVISSSLADFFGKIMQTAETNQQQTPNELPTPPLAQLLTQIYFNSLLSTNPSAMPPILSNNSPNSSMNSVSAACGSTACQIKLPCQLEGTATHGDGRTSTSECLPSRANEEAFPNSINSSPNNQTTIPLRPFMCPFCQTRFQAFSTFQAHQEFYCQARRDSIQLSSGSNVQHTSRSPTGIVSVSPISDHSSVAKSSAIKRKRARTSNSSESHVTTQNLFGDRISSTASSASASGDEGDGNRLQNSPTNNLLSRVKCREISNFQNKNEVDGTDSQTMVQSESIELRCSGCGYVGQTARGMKMHRRLHDCSDNADISETESPKKRKIRTENSTHHVGTKSTPINHTDSDKDDIRNTNRSVKSEPF